MRVGADVLSLSQGRCGGVMGDVCGLGGKGEGAKQESGMRTEARMKGVAKLLLSAMPIRIATRS